MIDWELAKYGIYKIHVNIYLGQYPKEESLSKLLELGVKHILNVSGGHYSDNRFSVHNVPVVDLSLMPVEVGIKVAGIIKSAVTNGETIFVHCMAGQNRSPGSIYLGLRKLGYSDQDSVKMIEDNSLDAVAKHHKIINEELIQSVLRSET